MAYNEAADPSNPNARGAGTTKPAGRSYEPPNKLNEGEKGGEEDDMGEWASGIKTPSSNDDSGDEDVRHVTPLEGEEKYGQQLSGQVHETAMHLKTPRHELSATQPRRTPYDKTLNREGRGEAVSSDNKVEGSEDEWNASYRVNEGHRRRDEARNEATEVDRGDKGSENDQEMTNEGEGSHSPLPTTPNLPFRQPAHTSRQSTYQQCRDGQVPHTKTCRQRRDDDVEWSQGGVESRDRGSREAVDKDSEDDDHHHAHVEPQQPQTVSQTADIEATDTTDPNTTSARPAVPVGTSYGPPNESNDDSNARDQEEGKRDGEVVEGEDEKGGRVCESAALSSNDDGGDEDVRHVYVIPKPAPPSPNHVPPPPGERRPPPSVPLEGEEVDQQSSGHDNEMATHLEHPRQESSTPQPRRTLYDETSNGEGQGEAVSGDDEVEGSEDKQNTSYGVDEQRRQREKAGDEATGDEEGREVEERTNEGEEGRTSVQARTSTDMVKPPPAFHPPSAPSSPNHPE
ncbi:hypothetical protein PAXINDRAFT_17135 [Paxillus involutus ATCC 200175]|uniref:Uncharacterized protein n=1 Tax=Paxillus involutus ATCC 200175 TaxID=664439 RepID=A0A0C9TPU8_PAXIN|nr:hypothetical protein PAXINDRAFT_17135 [Paxillus involutus ATCC 200175]